jgi:hypothetical protein
MRLKAHITGPSLDRTIQQPRGADQEEALVLDDRDQVTPAEAVERNLVAKLRTVQVSHVRFSTRSFCRSHC